MEFTERAIIFNDDMVNAILDGSKTQTRNQLTLKDIHNIGLGAQLGECHPLGQLTSSDMNYVSSFCPFGLIGDVLYVRENFAIVGDPGKTPCPRKYLVYRADYPACVDKSFESKSVPHVSQIHFTPSMLMPKWASRIMLRITNIRVERITDISVANAIAEGIKATSDGKYRDYSNDEGGETDPINSFKTFWCKRRLNWDECIYTWVIEFKVITTSGY